MRVLKPILNNLLFHPTRIAVIDDQKTWKGVELYIGSLHLARALEARTDKPHIGVILPTSGLFPLSMIAAWRLGRTIVPLNYLASPDVLEFMLDDAGIDTVITVKPMLEFIGGKLPGNAKPLMLEDISFKGAPPIRFRKKRSDDELAALLYTSGTSGQPKGVMLTVGNLLANARQCREWVDFNRQDIMLGVLPQFHSFGLTVLTILPLAAGMKVVYTARFMPRKLIGLMKKHRPTVFIAIPSMYGALLAVKGAQPDDLASLRYAVSGAEPLPESIFDNFRERFNITINEGYGLTETAPVTNWCRPHEHKRKSVGKALPRIEQRIVSPERAVLNANEEGEVCIRGPNVMKGYYQLPEATAAVFDEEGYFRTGDMGRIDEEGHLYITGRIKEMLIIGGENVFPREIEEVLNKHESIHASAVIGVHDDMRGEVPLAFVELEDGAEFSETELRSFCRDILAQYKVPREIRVLSELPRNPTGKILRRALSADLRSIV